MVLGMQQGTPQASPLPRLCRSVAGSGEKLRLLVARPKPRDDGESTRPLERALHAPPWLQLSSALKITHQRV